MGSRAFGGFTYRDRIELGFYGELSRAVNGAGQQLRILHVDRDLARQPGFAEALARHGGGLGVLEHRTIVATRTLGRTPEGTLVVVTEALRDPLSVERLLDAGTPPPAVALALGMALAEALAIAHSRGIVHGRIHPRSLLVDTAGMVRVDHFAVARALATVASRTDEPDPAEDFRGYLAPELAAGGPPSVAGDIYAAGALLYALHGGDPAGGAQLGRIRATTAIRRVVSRAMDAIAAQRFVDGGELRDALVQAAAADGAQRIGAAGLAIWLEETRVKVGDDSRGVAVDGVLASLEGTGEVDIDAATEDLLEDLSAPAAESTGSVDLPTRVDPRRQASSSAVDDVLAGLDDDTGIGDSSQLTEVDEPPGPGRDPVSELISLGTPKAVLDKPTMPLRGKEVDLDDDEHTPLPPPTPERDGTFTRDGGRVLADKGRGRLLEAAAVEAISELEREGSPELEREEEQDRPRAKVRVPSDATLHVPPPSVKGGLPGWFYLLLLVGALGLMFWLVWTRTDVLHPERARARERQQQAEHRAKEARLRAGQQRGAHIAINSDPAGAAVWMKLGDTPLDSLPLPAYMPHQLRLQHPGYRTVDLTVTAPDWSGDTALVKASLPPAAAGDPPARAWPPELPPGADKGFSGSGRGRLRVESTPSHAEVWLLVGYTNDVDMNDFPAGIRYEFEVRKDGYLPGRVVIEADEWRDHASMDPGAMLAELQRSVTLEKAPDEPK